MTKTTNNTTSRREFIKTTSRIAAASSLVGTAAQHVHAGEDNTIQLALVGCGGRGTGAANNALSVDNGPIKLVAMADIFENRLQRSHQNLTRRQGDKVAVPEDHRFIGLDGYKKAMDCLRPGDVAIFGTPPAFRWVHFTYAIEKGLNVFMEKPVTVDGPTTRRMIKLAAEADKKNLKVGVGLMVRHCRGRQELKKRIDDGEIGNIIAMRAYRMSGVSQNAYCPPRTVDRATEGMSELEYQIKRFHSFLWASGGVYSDYYIHQIDECSWMKGAWPIEAHALGGRHYRGNAVDQNLDIYAVEYTFPDGTKLFYEGRNMTGCENGFASYAHGSKGSAIISTRGHAPGNVRTYNGQKLEKEDLIWGPPEYQPNPYDMEWVDLIEAIREDKPYNEAKRGAEGSLVTSMGRMAAHTGQIITFDDILNCKHEFAPGLDKLTAESPAPIQADEEGKYPVPMPGIVKDQEYST